MKPAKKHPNLVSFIKIAVDEGRILYSSHAQTRMFERRITKPEVEFILEKGRHEPIKDQFNFQHRQWDYAIRGKTFDHRELRVVVALVSPNLLIVTAIDLNSKE